MLEANSHLLN